MKVFSKLRTLISRSEELVSAVMEDITDMKDLRHFQTKRAY
jgi:hypothetical protein